MNEPELQEWIDGCRQAPGEADGWLWARLSLSERLDPGQLASLLQQKHAVHLLQDQQLDRCTALQVDGHAALVRCDGLVHLVVDDPWSAHSLRRLDAVTEAGTVLTIARPGQRACWKAGGATQQREDKAGDATGNGSELKTGVVVEFVHGTIVQAYETGASDIHFETSRSGVAIKYRIDGVMSAGAVLNDPARAEEVISRIKVLAQLDITERRRPQDGRIRWEYNPGHSIDLRVSIMPSIFGEDAVLRLLDKAQLRHDTQAISLDILGFSPVLAEQVRSLASKPHGMLLVTGPTGSGKTTTVYAALSEVNDGLEKIVTIEDPVEYELPGVLQIPVNEQKGLTFATGLRSILRHDPDKILVGEIRDAETAQIAVQSALTGHLVFTTVHANSLLDVLGRFRHFGIEPFALASALNGVVVQRLLRQCCPDCLEWRPLLASEQEMFARDGLPEPLRVPVVRGCGHCRDTGYKGRFVLAEVHTLTDRIRDMMLTQESMSGFKELLYGDGRMRLANQAVGLIEQGQTSLEEVRRVVGLG